MRHGSKFRGYVGRAPLQQVRWTPRSARPGRRSAEIGADSGPGPPVTPVRSPFATVAALLVRPHPARSPLHGAPGDRPLWSVAEKGRGTPAPLLRAITSVRPEALVAISAPRSSAACTAVQGHDA